MTPIADAMFGMAEEKIKAVLTVTKTARVGSALFMPNPNDFDLLVLVPEELGSPLVGTRSACEAAGFAMNDSGGYPQDTLLTCRWGAINFIITDGTYFFDNFELAARVCARLNVTSKPLRALIHSMGADNLDLDEAVVACGIDKLLNEEAP